MVLLYLYLSCYSISMLFCFVNILLFLLKKINFSPVFHFLLYISVIFSHIYFQYFILMCKLMVIFVFLFIILFSKILTFHNNFIQYTTIFS